MKSLSALVFGATGEVGKAIVAELSTKPEFGCVRLITRRPTKFTGEAKFDQIVVEDFGKLQEQKDAFNGFDVCICALGTTRGKSGKEGFYKVDHDYIVDIAKLSKGAGVKQFHLISSTGANKDSYFFYPKTKGETEEDISELEFDRLSIYRPSLLLVKREESRPLERMFQTIMSPLDYWRMGSVEVQRLAHVLVENCLNTFGEVKGKEILENSQIVSMADKLDKQKVSSGDQQTPAS